LINAVKFTHNGKVELVAERQLGQSSDDLVIHIVDTGIGIASDQIANLFEKFTVADDSSTSKYGGTGLGLALSQKLSKLMGGEIFVESELGKGSRFTIRVGRCSVEGRRGCILLPRRSSLQLPILLRKRPMHKILLVEDNEINRDMLTRRLAAFTVSRSVCAHDWRSGCEMARARCRI